MRNRHRELVHVGRDGWLFLTGGTNGVLRQYRRSFAAWRHHRAWARLIRARAARARGLGIQYLHLIVPEKLSVYDDRTVELPYDPDLSPARRIGRRLARLPGYVDLIAPMRAARDQDPPLYHRTDTHWSYEGCYLAYRALLHACGAVPPPDIAKRPRHVTEGVWDLGNKLPDRPVEALTHWAVGRDAVRTYSSPIVASFEAAGRGDALHIGAHVVYRNEAAHADPRTVVMFGDSYSHFAQIMLTAFVSETFRETHFIWSASLDWGYIERVRPDLLVFEIAERFVRRLPEDNFDIVAYDEAERRSPSRPVSLELSA